MTEYLIGTTMKLHEIIPGLEKLYQNMSDDQKKIFSCEYDIKILVKNEIDLIRNKKTELDKNILIILQNYFDKINK